MTDLERDAEIRRLFFAEHWKKGTICAQLGVHHDVVERAIGNLGPNPKSGPRPSVLDPYKGLVQDTLEQYPRVCASRIFDMATSRGYPGSERTMRRYVSAVRPAPRKEAFLRTETLPGEQSQIDWGHVGTLRIDGITRALWVFVIVLAHSRALWAELVLDLTVHSLKRSLVRAAVYFGGLTRQWLFDNPKIVVLSRRGDIIIFHPELLALCSEMHAQPRLCAVRKPNHKGGVERAVRYLKQRFFAARVIRDLDAGNAQLLEFAQGIAMRRPHPVQAGKTVADVFAHEQTHLLPLPSVLPCTDAITPAVVDTTASVHFDTNIYSVPPEHVGQTLTLVTNDVSVRVLDGEHEVAHHPRCWAKKHVIERPEHRDPITARKKAARDAKGRDRLRAEVPRVDELLQRWADDGRNLGSMVARTMKLLDLYGPRTLSEAIHELLQRGGDDFGALTILCEKRRNKPHVVLPLDLAPHVQDRDVIPHDLGGYDDDQDLGGNDDND